MSGGKLLAFEGWFNRFDDEGNPTGWRLFGDEGNVIVCAVSLPMEKKERISKMPNTYGQALDTVYIPKPPEIKLSFDSVRPKDLAMVFLGEESEDVSQGSGSVSDEEITAKLGVYVELSKQNIAEGSVVVKDEDGSQTYEEGKDYVIHYGLGMIKAISNGAISEGEVLRVSYDFNAITWKRVKTLKRPVVKGAMRLFGKNLTTGKKCKVEFYHVVLQPDKEVDFLSNDFMELGFTGTLVTPAGRETPFEWYEEV